MAHNAHDNKQYLIFECYNNIRGFSFKILQVAFEAVVCL